MSWHTRMAAPLSTYDGRTRTGKLSFLQKSSASSMDCTEVPRIWIPFAARPIARLFGVCPPTLITTPSGFSKAQTSRIVSSESSSKYRRSDSSKSVLTVSGLQLITMACAPCERSVWMHDTQHESNSTLLPMRYGPQPSTMTPLAAPLRGTTAWLAPTDFRPSALAVRARAMAVRSCCDGEFCCEAVLFSPISLICDLSCD